MPLKEKILASLKRQSLIVPGDKVLVGVSGGADSVALLSILYFLQSAVGFQIHIGHINHHLRKSSDKDQNFVKKLCASLPVPCSCVDLDLEKKIKQGGSIEEIARKERFRALIKIAKNEHCQTIALAHHNDDLAETLLLRILRGCGLQGLQAIRPKRTIDGAVFIRPLLDVSRQEIEEYLKKNKIKFRVDPTNSQTHFFRNKIRHHLLPLLENKYQKNVKQLLSFLALTAGDDYEYLKGQALKIFSSLGVVRQKKARIPLPKFKKLPPAIKRMILRLAIEKIQGHTRALTLTHFFELDDLIDKRPQGSVVNLPNGLLALKTKDFLIFELGV